MTTEVLHVRCQTVLPGARLLHEGADARRQVHRSQPACDAHQQAHRTLGADSRLTMAQAPDHRPVEPGTWPRCKESRLVDIDTLRRRYICHVCSWE
jgi:hypothetical protein